MLWKAKRLGLNPDFAMINGGNIRAALPEGKIKYKDVYNVLPFDNQMVQISISGEKLLEMFRFIASQSLPTAGFAHFSSAVHLQIQYDMKESDGRLVQVSLDEKPIDRKREYKIVLSDYLATGKDGYSILLQRNGELECLHVFLRDLFHEYLKFQADAEGKIVVPALPVGRLEQLGFQRK